MKFLIDEDNLVDNNSRIKVYHRIIMSGILIFLFLTTSSLAIEQVDTIHNNEYYDIAPHELIFMPTAYTLPKGEKCFTDYELFVLNFDFGITSSTQLSVVVPFPITLDLIEFSSFGIKQTLFKKGIFANAIWGNYLFKENAYSIGTVASIGRRNKLHFAICQFGKDDDNSVVLMWGANLRTGKHSQFLMALFL